MSPNVYTASQQCRWISMSFVDALKLPYVNGEKCIFVSAINYEFPVWTTITLKSCIYNSTLFTEAIVTLHSDGSREILTEFTSYTTKSLPGIKANKILFMDTAHGLGGVPLVTRLEINLQSHWRWNLTLKKRQQKVDSPCFRDGLNWLKNLSNIFFLKAIYNYL